jgi:hypothetical protein
MAIIQKALAEELRCPVSEIKVGTYCIQTGSHEYISLSDARIAVAIAEVQQILNVVEAEIQRLQRAKP